MEPQINTAKDTANLEGLELSHVPQIFIEKEGVRIRVGANAHPMFPEHFIGWIELYANGNLAGRLDLRPGDEPTALFNKPTDIHELKALAFCNVHGLWENKILQN